MSEREMRKWEMKTEKVKNREEKKRDNAFWEGRKKEYQKEGKKIGNYLKKGTKEEKKEKKEKK